MHMDDFDYELADERIAQVPIEPRDAARLLDASDPSSVVHRHVRDLPMLLDTGDVVVLNETKVIPARLRLQKPSGGHVEVLLLERRADGPWLALVRPSKRVAVGTELVGTERPLGSGLVVQVGAVLEGGRREVRLLSPTTHSMLLPLEEEAALLAHGEAPLPPYISSKLADPNRYQTVYARLPGSVAAPTAGLHLTNPLLAQLEARGVVLHRVDLTVGLDTFRPVATDDPDNHVMHSERYDVPAATLDACAEARSAGRRVLVVGTTALRAVESAAATGVLRGRTDIFIRGTYGFRVADHLLTNFHLPRSTLLLLVDAFAGPRWRDLYAIAMADGYRFLSFGDAMLLQRRVT